MSFFMLIDLKFHWILCVRHYISEHCRSNSNFLCPQGAPIYVGESDINQYIMTIYVMMDYKEQTAQLPTLPEIGSASYVDVQAKSH